MHGTGTFDFFSLNFIIQKNIDPNLSMSNAQVSIADLKVGIAQRLTGKELELFDLNNGIMAAFKNMTEFQKYIFSMPIAQGAD